ncbi:MAG TPA: nicotinamidase [Dissulfurispiraceae bacterium]|nr:nicotinamidase [Dissulfurispiraceae bacterium]
MKALLVVDVQNDFCPSGALPAPEGDKVVPVINRLMAKFQLVVASKDWHSETTEHFRKWPRHCVQGTKGAELHPDLEKYRIDRIFLKGTEDKDEGYSAFDATNVDLERFLKDRGTDTLYITGIATEYCVKESALDAVKRGFTTYVVKDAVEGVNLKEGDVARALGEMEKAGVKVISSAEILR